MGLGRRAAPSVRPIGQTHPTIWVHAAQPVDLAALAEVIEAARDQAPGLRGIVSGTVVAGDTASQGLVDEGLVSLVAGPRPTARGVARFLHQWHPMMALWSGMADPLEVLEVLRARGFPVSLFDGCQPPSLSGRQRRLQRQVYGHFSSVSAIDAKAADALRPMLGPGARLHIAAPLARLPDPPRCSETEREDFASVLQSRPVWCAAHPSESEIETILAAHRTLRSGSHRLLLILVVEDEARGALLTGDLKAEGWQVARRTTDDAPNETTEVFVADTPDEAGLWFRISPITLIGGSLTGAPLADLAGAAQLGSALVLGPKLSMATPAQAKWISQLTGAGAVEPVVWPQDLAAILSKLLLPDAAALLAHRAWEVTSAAAETQERLLDTVKEQLRKAAG